MAHTSAIVTAGVIGLVVAGLAHPAAAKGHSTGRVSVDVADGCKAHLTGPGKQKTSRKVPASGLVGGLAPGTYHLKAGPSLCKAVPGKFKVKRGAVAAAKVLYDPRVVPTTIDGTFSGKEEVLGTSAVTAWSGRLTLTLRSVDSSAVTAFPQRAIYELTSAAGTWTISGTGVSCTRQGNGVFGLGDIRTDEQYWVNPWRGYTYTIHAIGSFTTMWPYVEACPAFGGGETLRDRSQEFPFPLVTNPWSGADPLPPLPGGPQLSGSFSRESGGERWSWTWDLKAGPGEQYSKPKVPLGSG